MALWYFNTVRLASESGSSSKVDSQIDRVEWSELPISLLDERFINNGE